MKEDSAEKLEKLRENLKKMDNVAVGFSGGVDSAFLLKTAHDILGDKVIAVTAISPLYTNKEIEESRYFANNIGVQQRFIKSKYEDIEKISKNPVNRCYYCKKNLFSKIKKFAKKENIAFVLDGSNADDVEDYRPGLKAINELGVVSPLIDVGLTKREIRDLSKEMNLDTWNKSESACLASRFPYNTEITKSRLEKIQKAEDFIRELGVKKFRVRFHEEIARIEVPKYNFKIILNHSDEIVKKFKELGFIYITLDIKGYRSGSLNEVLKK